MDSGNRGEKIPLGSTISTEGEAVITVDRVAKKYCKSLKRSMRYGISDILRNAVGLSSHPEVLRPEEFWAIDDISFSVQKGEIFGIIGPNGSGKSTLLKMLNGIFWPDRGSIRIRGKVVSFIEMGAGLHPILTGRENIFFNAALVGMAPHEIEGKVEEIIKFADIGEFINIPVRNFSAGMWVRLGFSIASHCDHDIFLVDEVLSAGDLSFSLKCNQHMKTLREQGKSIVIVSHNIPVIRKICDRVIWLGKGKILALGEPDDICDQYRIQVESMAD